MVFMMALMFGESEEMLTPFFIRSCPTIAKNIDEARSKYFINEIIAIVLTL